MTHDQNCSRGGERETEKIYAIGGFSHSALATVEVYDPVANS